jgi:hypothetical protein
LVFFCFFLTGSMIAARLGRRSPALRGANRIPRARRGPHRLPRDVELDQAAQVAAYPAGASGKAMENIALAGARHASPELFFFTF